MVLSDIFLLATGILFKLIYWLWSMVSCSHSNIFELRPISLWTFANKIISKILANCLALILPWIINEHQSGLVKGRSIQESITLAQELVQDIDRKKEWGNVIFKTDMSKAYDRLEWRFIILTLKAMS